MDIDLFSIPLAVAIYLAGIITSTFSEVIRDALSEPYHRRKGKKDIKRENIEAVRSLIADFCSSWELFKCRSIPSIDLEIDLINACRDIFSLVSKNESDFRENDVGKSIKDVCNKFISLHPQNDDCSGWSHRVECQIDELCAEFIKHKEMLEKW